VPASLTFKAELLREDCYDYTESRIFLATPFET